MGDFEDKITKLFNGEQIYNDVVVVPEGYEDIEGLDKFLSNVVQSHELNMMIGRLKRLGLSPDDQEFWRRIRENFCEMLEEKYCELSPWNVYYYIKDYSYRVKEAFYKYFQEKYGFFKMTDNMEKWLERDRYNTFDYCGEHTMALVYDQNLIHIDVKCKEGTGKIRLGKSDFIQYGEVIDEALQISKEVMPSKVSRKDYQVNYIAKYNKCIDERELLYPIVLGIMAAAGGVDSGRLAIIGRFNKLGDFKYADVSRVAIEAAMKAGTKVSFLYGTERFYDSEMIEDLEKKIFFDPIYVSDYMEIWDMIKHNIIY